MARRLRGDSICSEPLSEASYVLGNIGACALDISVGDAFSFVCGKAHASHERYGMGLEKVRGACTCSYACEYWEVQVRWMCIATW